MEIVQQATTAGAVHPIVMTEWGYCDCTGQPGLGNLDQLRNTHVDLAGGYERELDRVVRVNSWLPDMFDANWNLLVGVTRRVASSRIGCTLTGISSFGLRPEGKDVNPRTWRQLAFPELLLSSPPSYAMFRCPAIARATALVLLRTTPARNRARLHVDACPPGRVSSAHATARGTGNSVGRANSSKVERYRPVRARDAASLRSSSAWTPGSTLG